MTSTDTGREVLLTGATGFVGNALFPVLKRAGYSVRCATRTPHRAQKRWPERNWVRMDVEDSDSVRQAMEGCQAAYFLVHRMADTPDYEEREARAAMHFLDAASVSSVGRMVYLGGVKPAGEPARHLRSRLITGAILRSGEVSTIELRASMVIGHGSTSWKIVRDLARRLPVMVCPRWLRNRTEPVAIDDVAVALMAALQLETDDSHWYGIPGPEVMEFQYCIRRAAELMGRSPTMLDVPVLSPRLSSYWLRLVTGADYHVAKALAEGLKDDLIADGEDFWSVIGHRDLVSYDESVRRALESENRGEDRQVAQPQVVELVEQLPEVTELPGQPRP